MAQNENGPVEQCPFCMSENVLPFEEDTKDQSDLPLLLTILTALCVLGIYFAFVITSYLFFPLVVFIAIILTTGIINRREKSRRKTIIHVNREYICLNCNNNFTESEGRRSAGA